MKRKEVVDFEADVLEEVREFLRAWDEERLVRRTDAAPVVRADGGVEWMRWGFARPGLGPVVNTRSERLGSAMWREAFAERRCVIPVAHFYEWDARKKCWLFSDPRERWLWMAGVWEESGDHGRCFSMLTTGANRAMGAVHDRMPTVLGETEVADYLDGGVQTFRPGEDSLTKCEVRSPLREGAVQGELF